MHTFFLWFKMREYLQQCLHEIDMHSKFPAKSALFFFFVYVVFSLKFQTLFDIKSFGSADCVQYRVVHREIL